MTSDLRFGAASARRWILLAALTLFGTQFSSGSLKHVQAHEGAVSETAAQIAWEVPLGYRGRFQHLPALGPAGEVAVQNCNDGLDGENPKLLAVLRPDGSEVWSRRFDAGFLYCAAPSVGTGPAIFDDAGNLYVAAFPQESTNIWSDWVLQSFSPTGDLLWDTPITAPSSAHFGVILGADRNVYLVEDTPWVLPRLRGYRSSDGGMLLDVELGPIEGSGGLGDPPHPLHAFSQGLYVGDYFTNRYYSYSGSLLREHAAGPLFNDWQSAPPGLGGARFRVDSNNTDNCQDDELLKMSPDGLAWSTPFRADAATCPSGLHVVALGNGGALVAEYGTSTDTGYVNATVLSNGGTLLWRTALTPPTGGNWRFVTAAAADETTNAVLLGQYEYDCEDDSGPLTCVGTALTVLDSSSGAYEHFTLTDIAPYGVHSDDALVLDRNRAYIGLDRTDERAHVGLGHSVAAVDIAGLERDLREVILHPDPSEPPPPPPPPPGTQPVQYLAMGDSFSSGVGVTPYDPASGDCKRSYAAYPRVFADDHASTVDMGEMPLFGSPAGHVACSGAKIKHILEVYKHGEPPQMHWLSGVTDLVTLTIGGNDVGFKGVLIWCWIHHRCDRTLDDVVSLAIRQLRPELKSLYKTLAAGNPAARFLILGYPHIFPHPGSVSEGCSGISPDEMKWLRDKNRDLYFVIKQAVEGAAAASGAQVSFVPKVLSALKGHEVCTPNPWVNSPSLEGSFHPKAAGYARLAELLANAFIG